MRDVLSLPPNEHFLEGFDLQSVFVGSILHLTWSSSYVHRIWGSCYPRVQEIKRRLGMRIQGTGHALPSKRLSALSQATAIESCNSVGLLGNFGIAELGLERVAGSFGAYEAGLQPLFFLFVCWLRLDNNFRIKAAIETLQTTGCDLRSGYAIRVRTIFYRVTL